MAKITLEVIADYLMDTYHKISSFVTNQTDGTQKTQVVNAAGAVVASEALSTAARQDILADNQTSGDQLVQVVSESGEVVSVTTDALHVALQGYRSSDATYQPLRLDKVTNSLQTIDYSHHEIHAGSHFYYTDSVSLASAATQDYLITTPNSTKWAHFLMSVSGSAVTQVLLYEGSDKNGTSEQTIFNSNRNSLTASVLAIHKGTSGGTTDGTLIWQRKSGAAAGASRTGMEATHSGEKILKQNTKYIIRVISGTADNLTNVQLDWYEHVDIT